MTAEQEDALYEFLLERQEPFSLKEIVHTVRAREKTPFERLSVEIAHLITQNRLAFKTGMNKWITRAGCFTGAKFAIEPTNDELINGILIPGHRFVPFSNPILRQNEYTCLWKGEEIPKSNTEAAPDELYPYYAVYGEEFAPQFIARENQANEDAYNEDPYEDPPEVSIKTFDMRVIYRECAFVPGDKLVLTLKDWRNAVFEVEKVAGEDWNKSELNEWIAIAEKAFQRSFEEIGADCQIEEQIAWAFYKGGSRMRNIPAYPLEDFLFEETDKIETVPFGIETRFWFAGKEIPDYPCLRGIQTQSDMTQIERVLLHYNIPISEYVVQAYVYDALFQGDADIAAIAQRIVPASVQMNVWQREFLNTYILETFDEFAEGYSIFLDKETGPLRQRSCELHTAVIDFSTQLERGRIDPTWLPKHSFIILSQIQNHVAVILEEITNTAEEITGTELDTLEHSLDSMVETYKDIKEMIEKSLDNYRQGNMTLVKKDTGPNLLWRTVQIGIGGTEVWRRLLLPQTVRLFELHKLIQALFGWTEVYPYRFIFDARAIPQFMNRDDTIKTDTMLAELAGHGFSELTYEYGTSWTVKVMILALYNAGKLEKAHCVAGECAPPPEQVEGPLRYRRFISSFDSMNEEERLLAHSHLGANFESDYFDLAECNKQIGPIISKIGSAI